MASEMEQLKMGDCLKSFKKDDMYWSILEDIQNDLSLCDIDLNESDESLKIRMRQWLSKNKKLIPIKNKACQYYINRNVNAPKNESNKTETLESILTVRRDWDTRLRYQLKTLAEQQKRDLIQLDGNGNNGNNGPSGDSSSTVAADSNSDSSEGNSNNSSDLRYIYTCEDLLETIASANLSNTEYNRSFNWGLIGVDLQTPNLMELRMKYKAFHPKYGNRHFGVSSISNSDNTAMVNEWKQLLSSEQPYLPQLRDNLKFGVLSGFRAKVWRAILGLPLHNTAEMNQYFESLLDSVDNWDIITDSLLRLDVEHTLDHCDYFPFDDLLNDVILAFSRDKTIANKCPFVINTALLQVNPSMNDGTDDADSHNLSENQKYNAEITAVESIIENIINSNEITEKPTKIPLLKNGETKSMVAPTAVPPCGVVPFHQQLMGVTPLCYLFTEAKDAYFVFRSLFCRYLCGLHIINSDRNCIIYLSAMFERLAQFCYPNAYYHCVQLSVHPLTIVFPWLFTAFSGYLYVDETLHLWDRILAYDSLELLPIVCAAIFGFRSTDIMKAQSETDVHCVFADIRALKVIPMIQHFLFSRNTVES